jgi:predicted phosphodiesterase
MMKNGARYKVQGTRLKTWMGLFFVVCRGPCAMRRFYHGIIAGVAGLMLVGLSAVACAGPLQSKERFHFVQITDTHFGNRDHLDRTRRLVEQINRLPFEIACVVHTGDVFADNIAADTITTEGLTVLRQLRAPLHILPGNHDILEKDLERTLQAYRQRVGPLIHQAVYHNVVFVFAYTEPLALGFEVKGYDPLKELKAALSSAGGRPVILFHHRAAVDDYYEFAAHPGWAGEARSQFEALLRAFNVKAVITGHFHRDELHLSDGIPTFAAPPVAGYWGRQASFRIYEYQDGIRTYRTIYLQD